MRPRRAHRADLVSGEIDALPRPLRAPVRGVVRTSEALRIGVGGLSAIGGLAGAVVGVVTLDGRLVLGAVLQLTMAALVLAMDLWQDHTVETFGPAGSFVIRVARRRLWRDERGLGGKLWLLVRGDHEWAVAVRRRADDPFGPTAHLARVGSEREAMDLADDLVRRLREGAAVDALGLAPSSTAGDGLRSGGEGA